MMLDMCMFSHTSAPTTFVSFQTVSCFEDSQLRDRSIGAVIFGHFEGFSAMVYSAHAISLDANGEYCDDNQ